MALGGMLLDTLEEGLSRSLSINPNTSSSRIRRFNQPFVRLGMDIHKISVDVTPLDRICECFMTFQSSD